MDRVSNIQANLAQWWRQSIDRGLVRLVFLLMILEGISHNEQTSYPLPTSFVTLLIFLDEFVINIAVEPEAIPLTHSPRPSDQGYRRVFHLHASRLNVSIARGIA
jgi:hypothetical protein